MLVLIARPARRSGMPAAHSQEGDLSGHGSPPVVPAPAQQYVQLKLESFPQRLSLAASARHALQGAGVQGLDQVPAGAALCAQVGARGSSATKDVAGKMMGGAHGEEADKVADAEDSHDALNEDLAHLHEGRGAKAVRATARSGGISPYLCS